MPASLTGMVLVGGNMGKDSVLGFDPLNWMKVSKESEKSVPAGEVHAADQNDTRVDQVSGSRVTAKQQIPSPVIGNKAPHIPKQLKLPDAIDNRADGVSVQRQKVVIGRRHENPSAEKTKSMPQNTEGIFQEPVHYVEPAMPTSGRIHPIQRNEWKINWLPFTLSSEQISTYIIIAYTALLLVLGYFVYNDLSKRTSRIEARLFVIEKALRSK
ncbi:MAG: hypothetical protein B6D34_07795 [Candidatus Brocadia sp. UTAMX1]|jgi:hypothetical protein|nr:MAG: hypothetical protein B6D34_07795 [Candidatus Brocadia sp. UTAMX1]